MNYKNRLIRIQDRLEAVRQDLAELIAESDIDSLLATHIRLCEAGEDITVVLLTEEIPT